MKLPCPFCRELILYRPDLAGQPVGCDLCGKQAVMPEPKSLPEPYQSDYRREIAKAEAKAKAVIQAQQRAAFRAEEERQKALYRRRVRQSKPARAAWVPFFIDLLDLKFKRYLTPQIIRGFWLLALLLGISTWGYTCLSRLPPMSETLTIQRDPSIKMRLYVLGKMIDEKESELRQKGNRQVRPQQELESEQQQIAKPLESEQQQIVRLFSKMSLDQLIAEKKKLEDQYPISRSVFNFRGWSLYGLLAAISTLGTIITLLFCRVACEMMIVIFNIAKSLVQIHEAIKSTPFSTPPAPLKETN